MDAPALVGRREELRALSDALARVNRTGSRILVVVGEAGVGKTRLLAEHVARSRHLATTLLARGSPLSASIPFTTIAEALERHLRSCNADEVERLVGDRRDALAAALPSVSAEGAREGVGRLAVLEALARLLVRVGDGRPVQVVLDDLHQADPSTWELVSYLGRNPLDAPVLVVGAVRPYPVAEQADLGRLIATLVKDGSADELHLRPLGSDDIADLADRTLGPEVVDAELRSWLFDRTRGNALYAVRLLEQLRRDPSLRVVPVSVKERVRMEIADLSPAAAEALELAAALGRSFPLRQLEGAMPQGAGTALDELVRRGLLVEQDEASAASMTYDFTHPLVQEAVYTSMGAGRRREVHAVLARALSDEPVAVRAYHVARSARTGDADAIRSLREAAAQAERAQAHREALGHLRAALELAPAGHPDREALLDQIAWHAQQASEHVIAIPALRELVELAGDDPVRLAGAKMRLASSLSIGEADLPAAGEQAREAVGLLERAGSPRRAAAINELGWILALAGDFESQEEPCRRAVALAEAAGDDWTLLRALGPLGHNLAMRGRFEEARPIGERCVRLATATGDALQVGWHTGIHATTLAYEGRFLEAVAVIDPVLAAGGDPGDVAYFNAAWIDWFHGRWSRALAACEAVAALHPTAPVAHSAWALSLGAALLAAADAPGRATPLFAQAERVYGERDLYWFSSGHRWAAGHVARLRGELDRAADLFERAVRWVDRCGLVALEALMLPDAVEALDDDGRTQEARRWADRAAALAEALGTPFAHALERHASGIVQRGPEALRTAAEGYQEVGAGGLVPRALERLGRTLSGPDRVEALTEAARRYAELPAPALAERVRAELRRLGPPGRRAAQRVGELTEREREVLALVRRGMSSREVAERLHVSVRTVDSHLARIYGKLGVRSRRDLVGLDQKV